MPTPPKLLDLIGALVATPSVSSFEADLNHGNRAVIDLLAGWLEDLGFHIEIQDLHTDPAKANLIATLGQGDDGLILAGHTDTVPCDPALWRRDPFTLHEADNRLYGLGTADMKAFLALAIEAVRGLRAGDLKRPLVLLATAADARIMRRARPLAAAGRGLDPALLGQLEGLANRGYTSGFYQRHTPQETQNYLKGYSESGRSQYVGDVLAFDAARGLAQVRVRNRFSVGDTLELIHPVGNRDVSLDRMENAEGQPLRVAPGDGHMVWLPLPASSVGAFVARYVNLDAGGPETAAV